MFQGWLGGPRLCLNKCLKQSKDDEFENDNKILLKLFDTPEGGKPLGGFNRFAHSAGPLLACWLSVVT